MELFKLRKGLFVIDGELNSGDTHLKHLSCNGNTESLCRSERHVLFHE